MYITPPLPACIVYDCREGRGGIHRVLASTLVSVIFSPVTVYSLYITPRPSLQSYTMHAERGGVIYREYTECYSISFLFLFFFHQSSLYPIKIFAKCFYLQVCILFSAPNLSELKLIIFLFFVNRQCILMATVIGFRFATLLHHSLVQLCCKFKACGL